MVSRCADDLPHTRLKRTAFPSSHQSNRRLSDHCPLTTSHCLQTIPFRNSSSEYFVPRHTIPPWRIVNTIERASV